MKYRIIDRPVFTPRSAYYSSIDKVVKNLQTEKAVAGIYRMGNITDPGISDVDMLIVLRDSELLEYDPRNVLDKTGKYLFTHQLFALPEFLIRDAMNNTLYHNYDFLAGENILSKYIGQSPGSETKRQIAFEYLLKLFISLSIQKSVGVIKQRSFLLETKAVKFDLEILDGISHLLEPLVSEVTGLRSNWFEQKISDDAFAILFESFYKQLTKAMEVLVQNELLYTGIDSDFVQVGKNILLKREKSFGLEYNLPVFKHLMFLIPGRYLRKFTGLLNRTTNYFFYLPFASDTLSLDVRKKFEYEKVSIEYLKSFAPNCIPMKSPLTLF